MCSSTQTSWGHSQIQVTLDSLNKTLSIQQREHRLPLTSITQLHRDCRHASSPLERQIYSWKAVPSSPNLPLGGSPLLSSFIWEAAPASTHLKVIPLITLFVTQDSTKEEIPSSLWKKSLFFYLFQFSVDANNGHYRLPILLVSYKNDSFFSFLLNDTQTHKPQEVEFVQSSIHNNMETLHSFVSVALQKWPFLVITSGLDL